jgi:multiple sugar transport system ATP-binding protein
MDEPLSNLDAKLRVQMRAAIQKLQHRLGTTTLYVTHDQVEAMTMGDRVAVMRDGRAVQVDTPQALYERPADLFVAGFIGSPAMNLLRARVRGSNGKLAVELGSATLELPRSELPPAVAGRDSGEVIIGLRPEHLRDAALEGSANGHPVLCAPVTLAEPVGSEVIAHLELGAPALDPASLEQGATDDWTEERADFVVRLDARSRAARGEPLTLLVEPSKLYFFDPETEIALR